MFVFYCIGTEVLIGFYAKFFGDFSPRVWIAGFQLTQFLEGVFPMLLSEFFPQVLYVFGDFPEFYNVTMWIGGVVGSEVGSNFLGFFEQQTVLLVASEGRSVWAGVIFVS